MTNTMDPESFLILAGFLPDWERASHINTSL